MTMRYAHLSRETCRDAGALLDRGDQVMATEWQRKESASQVAEKLWRRRVLPPPVDVRELQAGRDLGRQPSDITGEGGPGVFRGVPLGGVGGCRVRAMGRQRKRILSSAKKSGGAGV